MLRFRGCEHFRQRIVLSCLSGKPIRIDDIRSDDESPGLKGFEASMLRLTEKVSNGCLVEINETGTTLRFRPGVIVGGSDLSHDCGKERAIGYFLEPLMLMCMFGKKPLNITLRGLTNAASDISIDTFRAVTLPAFKRCGVQATLTMKQRSVGPEGRGTVHLAMNFLKEIEQPLRVTDEGLVKRIRGVAWTVRMGPQYATSTFSAAKGVLLKLLADVQIFTDVVSVKDEPGRAKASAGYGISLIAETDSGCFISAERCISGAEMLQCREEQVTSSDVGEQAACMLLDEINRGGVVDGTHQSLLLTLAALGPKEVNKVRLGSLAMHAIKTLRHIKDFLDVQFDIKPDAESGTIFFSCIGCGMKNFGRKVQ